MELSNRIRNWLRNPWVMSFLFGVVFLTAIRPLTRKIPDPPQVLGEVGNWELMDTNQNRFGSAQLIGKVHIVGFFFSSCKTVCPLIINHLKKLESRLARGRYEVPFVLISVDPQTDTPQHLSQFAKDQNLISPQWNLLSGSIDEVTRIAEKNLLIGLGLSAEKAGSSSVELVHNQKLILVDSKGNHRGAYDSSLEGVEELFHRAERLTVDHLVSVQRN